MPLLARQIDLDLLGVVRGAITLVIDPSKTESVYDVEDGLRHRRATTLAVEFVQQHPALGHASASYLHESGIEVDFYRVLAVEDDASYFLLRMRQTHDIWHLVAGFHTDVPGELGLKAFELAQTRRPLSAVLLSGGVLSAVFKAPETIGPL